MRILAPALLLLMASCGREEPAANRAVPPPMNTVGPGPQQALPPTISIAADCAATWDGQATTRLQITQRSGALIQRAIEAVGGRQNFNIDDLPMPIVEAPAGLDMVCADTILSALQRAGMASVMLKLAGGGAAVLMDFPSNADRPPPPVPMALGLHAGGRITWNGDPIDAAGLTALLTRIGGSLAAPDEEAPPGDLELRVRRETTFGQLYGLLQTIRRYHLRPEVYLPSAQEEPAR